MTRVIAITRTSAGIGRAAAVGLAPRRCGPLQTAGHVADAIARAVERPVAEMYPYRNSRGLVRLTAIAPRLTDRMVKKWGRKPIQP
jgi:hypothetical protein